MPLPSARLTRTDGALAIAPAATDAVNCLVGVCSAATPNVMQGWTDSGAMARALGVGPLVQAAAVEIDQVGQVYTLAVPSDVAGAVGAVKVTGSSPAPTVTGAPLDDFLVRGTVVAGGPLGTATIALSLDGGNTYGAPLVTAAKLGLAGTGLTLGLAAGTYNPGDTFAADCSAPGYSVAELVPVRDVLRKDRREWGLLHFVGGLGAADPKTAIVACQQRAGAAAGIMAYLADRYRYARALVDAPDVADDPLIAAFASYADAGVLVGAGFHDLASPLDNRSYKRPIGWTYAPRVAGIPIQEHPGMVARGPLPSAVSRLYTDDPSALNDARFVTLRTFEGQPGFYITRGPTMALPTSDYSEHQRCRVIDRASKVARLALLRWLNRDLDVNPDGTLTDVQADLIDADLVRDLRAALLDTNAANDVSAKVNRAVNVESTSTLSGKFRVRAKGYASFIDWELGFSAVTAAKAA